MDNNVSNENIKEINDNKNGKKSNSVIFIVIIVYLAIASCITVGLISFHNKNGMGLLEKITGKNTESENSSGLISNIISAVSNDNAIKRVTNDDRFFINNIVFNEKSADSQEMISSPYDGMIPFVEVRYYEIVGLKDKQIQELINNELMEKTLELKTEIDDYISQNGKEKIKNVVITPYIGMNSNNVLSIEIARYVYFNKPNNEKEEYEYDDSLDKRVDLNYRLDTGDKINFNDCFTEDASIKSILSRAYYRLAVWNYTDEFNMDWDNPDYDGEYDLDKIDYGTIENDTFKMMTSYIQNADDVSFTIETRFITAKFGKYSVTIDLLDNKEYIDVGIKYLTEDSIFEEGNLERNNLIYCTPIQAFAKYFDFFSSNKFLAVDQYDYDYNFNRINKIEDDTTSSLTEEEKEEYQMVQEKFEKYIAQNDDALPYKSYIYSFNINGTSNYMPNYTCYVDRVEFNTSDHNEFRKNVQDFYYSIMQAAKAEPSISFGYYDTDKLRELEPISFVLTLNDDGSISREEYSEKWNYVYGIEDEEISDEISN